jgi:cytochrome c oxidase subunit 3
MGPNGDLSASRTSVDVCALYWHFLLLVWLVMFALLLNT